jgi:hypothetical protein
MVITVPLLTWRFRRTSPKFRLIFTMGLPQALWVCSKIARKKEADTHLFLHRLGRYLRKITLCWIQHLLPLIHPFGVPIAPVHWSAELIDSVKW